jgi:hypothetical protein
MIGEVFELTNLPKNLRWEDLRNQDEIEVLINCSEAPKSDF